MSYPTAPTSTRQPLIVIAPQSQPADPATCTHPKEAIVLSCSGGMRLSGGDLVDDYQEILLCTLCWSELDRMPEDPDAPAQDDDDEIPF